MTGVSFSVAGPHGTKGSSKMVTSRRTGRAIMKPSSIHLVPWTKDCRWQAHLARVPLIPKGIGVRVDVTYEFVRPRKCPRRLPCIKPDVDKLARALLDALTGLAYVDDEQVVELLVRKVYGAADVAHVTIRSEGQV